jgi:hypothetical protein
MRGTYDVYIIGKSKGGTRGKEAADSVISF